MRVKVSAPPIMPSSPRPNSGHISRNALVAMATLTGISSLALAITLPYRNDFESTPVGTVPDDISYLTGDIGVEDSSATGGSKLLHLRSGTIPDVIGYDIIGAESGVYWLEFKIKAQATSAAIPFVDFDGAKLSLKTDTGGFAKLQVCNAGSWMPLDAQIATDANGLATVFARMALRVDYTTRRFHVFLDGALVASDLPLDNTTVTAPHNLEFHFTDVSEVFLDDLSLEAGIPMGSFADSDGDGLSDAAEINRETNPFTADSDVDGIPDGWEVAHGLNPLSASDAQLDSDSDGLTNLDEYRAGTEPYVSSIPSYGTTLGGALLRDVWKNITTTNLVTVSNSTFLFTSAPTTRTLLTEAETTLSGVAYGERLQGFITPAVTGDYRFAIASDDMSEFRLSTDETQSHTVKIASIDSGYTGFRNYAAKPSQVSALVHLESGRSYFLDIRHVNIGAGPGHLSLAWRTSDAQPWQGIPASVLKAGLPADDFHHASPSEWEKRYGAPGNVTRRVWPGATQSALINGANPVETTLQSPQLKAVTPTLSLAAGASSPRNTGDGFVQEITGYILPTVTGDYTVAICSDDRGALYLSSDDQPESLSRVAKVASYASYGNFTKESGQRSAPVHLDAGKRYLFRAFGLEIGGSDHVQLGWTTPGSATLAPIPSANVAPAVPLPLYTPDSTRLAFADDDGDGLNNLRESETGTNPAKADTDGDGMSDPWEIVRGLNPTNPADGAIDPDGDGLTNTREYETGNNPFVSELSTGAAGAWLHEQWNGIPGNRILDLETTTSGYTTALAVKTLFAGNEAATDRADNYGERLRAWISVPAEGDYVFFVSGDDDARFSLSPDEHVGRVRPVASFAGYTSNRQWLKYPTQRSATIHLLPGVRYYAELVHKEGGGADRFALGYKLASESDSAIRLLPIAWLSSFTSDPDDADGDGIPDAWEIRFAMGPNLVGDAWLDTDGDGLSNYREFINGTDPTVADTDGDGYSDGFEVANGMNPLGPDADEDQDGMPDAWETRHGLNPGVNDAEADPDGDGLSNVAELQRRTRANAVDSDSDGLNDGVEVALGLNPLIADSDHNGVKDADEDSDGDGMPNKWEADHGLNPASPADGADDADWDGDGLSNKREFHLRTNPAKADTDGDGLADGAEISLGTNPLNPDSDKDGLPDGWEVAHGFNPRSATGIDGKAVDADGDGLTNWEEFTSGGDPLNADTDGDGVSDKQEVIQNSNPSNAADSGLPPSADTLVDVAFSVGDPSGSHSEKWIMLIKPLSSSTAPSISFGNEVFGTTEDNKTFKLWKGVAYKITLKHNGSLNQQLPDFDWRALVAGQSGKTFSIAGGEWTVVDTKGLLSNEHNGSDTNDAEDRAVYLVPAPVLSVDYNRDRVIDEKDKGAATEAHPWRFWINDDADDGDYAKEGTEDIPGSGNPNFNEGHVKGLADMTDYFPVRIDADKTVAALWASGITGTWDLSCEDIALNVVYTDASPESISDWYFNPEKVNLLNDEQPFGVPIGEVKHAKKHPIHLAVWPANATRLKIEGSALGKMRNGPLVIYCDGRRVGYGKLKLTFRTLDNPEESFAERTLPMCITKIYDSTGPNTFFRWVNLRDAQGTFKENVIRPTNLSEPINNSDSDANSKHIVIVHGFKVDEASSVAWGAEFFKRLYWSGSRAKMTMVSWQGKPEGNVVDANYYKAVWNAFLSARPLNMAMDKLIQDSPGEITICGHSLGNMVISSAINDVGFRPYAYNLIDAAIPVEAFGDPEGGYFDNSMSRTSLYKIFIPNIPDWANYSEKAHASRWYKLWPASDERYSLGWPGRFASVKNSGVKLYNYYSGDEEVLRNAAHGREELGDIGNQAWEAGVNHGQYSWLAQEWNKGNFTRNVVTGSEDVLHQGGGWTGSGEEFDQSDWENKDHMLFPSFSGRTSFKLEPEHVNILISEERVEELRAHTIFTHFANDALHTSPVGAISLPTSIEQQSRAHILACQVPAATNPVGNNPVPYPNFTNYQMDDAVNKRGTDLNNKIPDSPDRAGWDFSITQNGFKDGWVYRGDELKSRWLHSDVKDVSYRNTHRVYDKIVQDSNLGLK